MKPKEITKYYDIRISSLETDLMMLKNKDTKLSYGRLLVFTMAFLGFALLYSFTWIAAIVWLIVFLMIFGWLVKVQNKIIFQREMKEYLVRINKMEKESIRGNFLNFYEGSEHANNNHQYTNDLDIFGRNSLFQMISRTASKPAGDLLAEWLKNAAVPDEIYLRQEASSELRERIEWRQQLMAIGYRYKDAGNNPDELLQWLNTSDMFSPLKFLRPLAYLLSSVTLATAVFVFFGLPFSLLVILLIINFLVNFVYQKKVNRLHLQVSKSNDMLLSYSEAVSLIETENFSSARLLSLQKSFRDEKPASMQIRRLSTLVNRLDTRLNLLVSVVLNLGFFWDIHVCFILEKWKNQNQQQVADWFSAMAEIEVLSSFANLYFNNPGWALPDIQDGPFHLKAVNTGHPLIPRDNRVCNSFTIHEPGRMFLITGSNMSGKSTFLRTIGINMVLAYAGSPVCADSFVLSPVRLLTSMRVSDSLEDNTSTFYAELKRLAMIIAETKKNSDVFLLLDEILHGTNSDDRHAGSVALIKQLIRYQATGMVATHDLALSKLEKGLKESIENYNFDVKIDGEELYFDYRLNKGICQSMNASLLMKKMGIEM